MTKDDIKKIVRDNKAILDRYKVTYIALFGSYVRNEQRQDSDIDFLIEFENPTFRNYIGFLSEMKRLFGDNVDLVCRDALKPRIRPYIISEAEEINYMEERDV